MGRIAAAPEGSLIRGLLARVAAEDEQQQAEAKANVGAKFADLMPVRGTRGA